MQTQMKTQSNAGDARGRRSGGLKTRFRALRTSQESALKLWGPLDPELNPLGEFQKSLERSKPL